MFRPLRLIAMLAWTWMQWQAPAFSQPYAIRHCGDSILTAELGKELFEARVALKEFEEVHLNRPGREDYRLIYTFTFPTGDTLELPFVCAVYGGEMHVQSGLFLRKDRSDLPPGFAENGINIITRDQAIDAACLSDSLLSANRSQLKAQLMLTQEALWWSVGFFQYIPNPEGDAEEWVWKGVRVDGIGKEK